MGVWLNVFVRQAAHLGMANIAQSVNVISPLLTSPEGLLRQTTWFPLLLFSRHMRGHSLGVHVRAGEYRGDTQPPWIRGAADTPWLDVSAAKGPGGWVALAVVNVHEETAFETELRGVAETEVEVYTVTGSNVKVVNSPDKEEVGIKESKWDGKGLFTFPKHSFTLLRWKP